MIKIKLLERGKEREREKGKERVNDRSTLDIQENFIRCPMRNVN